MRSSVDALVRFDITDGVSIVGKSVQRAPPYDATVMANVTMREQQGEDKNARREQGCRSYRVQPFEIRHLR